LKRAPNPLKIPTINKPVPAGFGQKHEEINSPPRFDGHRLGGKRCSLCHGARRDRSVRPAGGRLPAAFAGFRAGSRPGPPAPARPRCCTRPRSCSRCRSAAPHAGRPDAGAACARLFRRAGGPVFSASASRARWSAAACRAPAEAPAFPRRAIKSPREIACIAKSQRAAVAAMRAAVRVHPRRGDRPVRPAEARRKRSSRPKRSRR
jgi:hypothetical protein